MFPFRQIGFHRYLLPIVILWYFFVICQNTTVYIYKCYIRVQVIPRGIPTGKRRQYQMSLYRPIAMNNLYLHETKHALNFSSAFCMLFIYIYSWKCFWWEHIFFKGKKIKRGFSGVVRYGQSAFKLYPFNMKTGALKLYFFTRKYNVH